ARRLEAPRGAGRASPGMLREPRVVALMAAMRNRRPAESCASSVSRTKAGRATRPASGEGDQRQLIISGVGAEVVAAASECGTEAAQRDVLDRRQAGELDQC